MSNLPRKARSRLKTSPQRQRRRETIARHTAQLKTNTREIRRAVKSRLQYLPLLGLAGVCYAGLYWLVTAVRPEQVRNLLLPNSFLPFHALLLPADFFFFTFLTLSKRWGILIALMIQWLLFLKLQSFTLDIWAWLSAGVIGALGYGFRQWQRSRI